MIKFTRGQRIDLLGIRRTVKTCVKSDFCRFGVGDSTALGIALEERFQGLASPAKIKLAVTGCPRNCANALCKDLGVVAIEGGAGADGRFTSEERRVLTFARGSSGHGR